MRSGLSAYTLWPAPQVHFSLPGSVLMSLGQPFTTLYAPNMSWPPTIPGMAAKPTPARGCASIAELRFASSNPATQPIAATAISKAVLRIGVLPRILSLEELSQEKRDRDCDALFGRPQSVAPQSAALAVRALGEERDVPHRDGRDQHRQSQHGIIRQALPARGNQQP